MYIKQAMAIFVDSSLISEFNFKAGSSIVKVGTYLKVCTNFKACTNPEAGTNLKAGATNFNEKVNRGHH